METNASKLENTISNSGPSANVYKVSIVVPPFWLEEPALWFALLEAQFNLNNVTAESIKYLYVILNLSQNVANEVKALIIQPPKEEPYTKLRQTLISKFERLCEENLRQSLEKEEMGHRKPLAFLQHLTTLAGYVLPERTIKAIWLDKLPSAIQRILLSQKSATLMELGILADELNYMQTLCAFNDNAAGKKSPGAQTNGSKTALNKPVTRAEYNELVRIIDELRLEVRYFNRYLNYVIRNLSSSDCRDLRSGLCYYHKRFADKARRCTTSCSWMRGPTVKQGNSSSNL